MWLPQVPLSGERLDVMDRETKRRQELEELVGNGKIPHQVELEKHPEKSLAGLQCNYLEYSSTLELTNDNHYRANGESGWLDPCAYPSHFRFTLADILNY